MKPSKLTLQGLFGPDVRYLVPLYQRPYVWQRKSHWEPLWQDVLTVLERHCAGEQTRGHFLGAVVLEQEATNVAEVDRRFVIDGQQRLTTLQLLLAAAAAQAEEDGVEKVGRLLRKLVRNDEDLAVGDRRFKVWPTNADRDEFAAVMGGERDEQPNNGAGNEGIAAAYEYFRGAIRRWTHDDCTDAATLAQRFEALRAVLAGLLEVVSIDLEPGDDAQVIFETLNARGTPLLAMDLVKNAIVHRAEAEAPEAVDALHHEVWEPELGRSYWREPQRQGRLNRPRAELFLMHWLTMRLRESVAATELFAAFRGRVLDGPAPPPVAELIAELCADAGTMRAFDDLPPTSAEGMFFRRLAVLDTTTLLPLALLLLRGDALAPERRARALAALESWLVRRMLCGLTSKSYNRLVIDLLDAAAANLDRADDAIVALLDSWEAPTNRWPRDDEVMRCLTTRYAYGWIAQRRLVMVFDAVERRRRSAKTESILNPDAKLSIEHVMPQEWREHWPLPDDDGDDAIDAGDAGSARDALLHHLGNLTLVTGSLNASLSNAAWATKRTGLAEHSLLMLNSELAKLERWDERGIRARSRSLIAEICAIWLPPPTDRPLPDASSGRGTERTSLRWTIKDLVEVGKLAAGERLVPPPGRDSPAVATVGDDGTLEVGGELFRTPSAAAKRVTGKVAEHGWRFWRVERDGQQVEIDVLRAEMGAEDE